MKVKRKEPVQEPKVLLADPTPGSLDEPARRLRDAGFRVVALSHFDAAPPLFKVFKPDAMVIAAQPGDDWLKLGRKLVRLSRGTLPVIYLVDEPTPELRTRCLQRGLGVDVMVRPLVADELAEKLHSLIRLRSAVREESGAGGELGATSVLDPLTGTYNRHFLLAMMKEELRRGERYGECFSVIVGVLNGYSQFREKYGRELSQRLTVYASLVLSQTVREADVVARVSEDAFAILMPRTSADNLAPLISRLEARLRLSKFRVEGSWVKTTMALGHTSFPDVVGSPLRVLDQAFASVQQYRPKSFTGPSALTA